MNRRDLFRSLAYVALTLVGVRLIPKPQGVRISQATADRLRAAWDAAFMGSAPKTLILGDGLVYSMSDAEIAEAFHIPASERARCQRLFARHVARLRRWRL